MADYEIVALETTTPKLLAPASPDRGTINLLHITGEVSATSWTNTIANMSLTVGTNTQAWDADLDDLAGLSHSGNEILYSNAGTWAAGTAGTIRTILNVADGAEVNPTDEEIEDIVGGMLTGNTETLITVTYQDADGTIDFVVDNDLANYSNTNSAFITATGVTFEALNANSDVGTGASQVAAGNHNHSGVYEPADATIIKQADVDDTPVNGVTTAPVSSNWAYDHENAASAHGVSGSVVGTSDSQGLTNKTIDGDNNTLSNLDLGNEVDWAAAADVTDRTAFASGDKLLIFEVGVGMRKIDYDDLPGSGGGISSVVEDATPQLGGSLDVNGNKIVSVSNGDIDIEPNGTGNVLLGNFSFDADQSVGAGQDNYVLTYDNGSGLISLEAVSGGSGDLWSDPVDAVITPDADGTRDLATTGTRFATGYLDALNITNNITVGGTVDGRDLATDGTKLDGVEASADVTDETNVIAALDGATTTEVTPLAADKLLMLDASDSDNLKHCTFSDFATAAQGSTADSALQDVVDDTTPQLGGGLDCNGNNLTDVQQLLVDGTPDADHSATGFCTDTHNAGATIAAFELVYLHTDGEWALTDADASATAGPVMLGLALEAGTDGNPLEVALPGSYVRDDTWAWTVGAELYISTTPGDLTETAPSATGDIVRVVGYAVTADIVYFNPSPTWITI